VIGKDDEQGEERPEKATEKRNVKWTAVGVRNTFLTRYLV
jgi:hypothetical protein